MHHVTAALLQNTVVSYYKLQQIYCKLQQNIITNYRSLLQIKTALLQITVALLQITAKCYYKLRQLYYKLRQCVITNYDSFIKLLQITAAFRVITNYGNTLLQITADITIYGVITNYVVTLTGTS